jgi:hypothetical protein
MCGFELRFKPSRHGYLVSPQRQEAVDWWLAALKDHDGRLLLM